MGFKFRLFAMINITHATTILAVALLILAQFPLSVATRKLIGHPV
jgi:hypothetical protein